MEDIEMEVLADPEREIIYKTDVKKPNWMKRRIVWPLKTKLLKTFWFKVFALFLILGGYLSDVGFDIESGVSWFNMRSCFRTVYVNFEPIKTSEIVTGLDLNNIKKLLDKYGVEKESVRDKFKETVVWRAWNYLTDEFSTCAGYHTDITKHNNILRRRLEAFLEGTLSGFNTSTMIRHCKLNEKQISMVNLMDEICPEMEEGENQSNVELFEDKNCADIGTDAKSILQTIRKLLRKIENKVSPELLIEVMISMGNMNSTDLSKFELKDLLILPKEAWSVFIKALPVLNLKNHKSLLGCIFDKNNWKQLLDNCRTHAVEIECKDTSRDFCGNGEIGFGTIVIAAVFLPGLIQAIGNLIYYKAKEFPIGFGLENVIPGDMRCPFRICVFLFYIPCMVVVGPLHPLYSFYLLACKYYQEGKHGVIVEDGGDSRKDEIFLKFKEEKSTEGLSESFVQFTNQFCFMVFFIFMSQIEDFVPGFTTFLTFNGISQEKFLASWVPKTVVKSLISLWTFSFGVVTILQTDKLFQRRGIRTKFSIKIKEIMLMLLLTPFMSFLPILYISFMILFSIMTISSWSWTDQDPEAHHYLFLLPYLPLVLSPMAQFVLFQKFVKPKTARQQWYAFLSIIIPVRVHLIKDVNHAYKYFLASTLNLCTALTFSWMLLLVAIVHLPEIEDPDNGFLVFMCEIPTPIILYLCLQFYIASRLLWYLVIAPDFATIHCMPDFQPLEERLASFPNFWNYKFQDFLLQEVTNLKIESENLGNNPVTEREMTFLEKVAMERREDKEIEESIANVVETQDLTPYMTFSALSNTKIKIPKTSLNLKVPYNQILTKNVKHIQRMIWILENCNAENYAEKGFFYCHPRMTGLQVTCYSCGILLRGEECLSADFDSKHLPTCRRHSIPEISQTSKFIPLWLLPWSGVQAILTISTFLILYIEKTIMAHSFYSFLFISSGINLSIVSNLGHAGPELVNILKGIINYFIPLFLPSETDKMKKPFFFHLLCRVTTNFCICFITAFFKRQKETSMVFHASNLSTTHWAGLCLSFSAIVYSVIKFKESISREHEKKTIDAQKEDASEVTNENGKSVTEIHLVTKLNEERSSELEEIEISIEKMAVENKLEPSLSQEMPSTSAKRCSPMLCSRVKTSILSSSPILACNAASLAKCHKKRIWLFIDIAVLICSASVVFFIASYLSKKANFGEIDCEVAVDNECFKLMTDECPYGCTYNESQAICKLRGGMLVEPRTAKQMNILKDKLSQYKISHWWIGASDRNGENNWVWESDGAAAESLKDAWAAGEPNNSGGNQDCAKSDGLGKLDDINCETRAIWECHVTKPICQFRY